MTGPRSEKCSDQSSTENVYDRAKMSQVIPVLALIVIHFSFLSFLSLSLFFFFFLLFRAALTPYGGSQARGRIGAAAASLPHSHSNAGSEPRLQPTPQLMAMPDP